MLLRRAVFFLFVLATTARAQATSHIDPLNPVNDEIRLLVGDGLVDRVIVGQQPYTRRDAASIVCQAENRLQNARAGRDGLSQIGSGRAAFFDELLQSIRGQLGIDSECAGKVRLRLTPVVDPLRAISVDFTQAQSPTRLVPRDNGLGSIDALLNPLLSYREGRPLVDGSNLILDSQHVFESTHAALELEPEFQAFRTTTAEMQYRGTLQTGDLRVVFGNVGFDVGREYVRWGQANFGSLMNSANSPPLNQLRLTNEQPSVLPWFLRYLGPSKFSLFYAELGDEQNFPGAYFIGYKASFEPNSQFEFGGSVYSKSGGHGSPRGSFTARIIDIFPFLDASNYANIVGLRGVFEFSDRYAGLDARARFPSVLGLETYGELLLNDFDVRRLGSVLWEDAGHVFGISLSRLSSDGRVNGWLEYHHTGNRYYEHFQYLSGQTLHQTLIGDALGPDAQGVYGSLGWYRTASHRFSADFAVERRSDDQYMYWPVALPKFGWSRIQNRPKEWRERVIMSWHELPSGPVGLLFQGGYERAQNFNFLEGDSRNNLLARAALEFRFR